jgi:glycosyltransferase involved in cell wall biosynthesis
MRLISVVSGCYNEEDNVRELHERVCRVFGAELSEYAFEFIVIDNASKDGTVATLKEIAARDKRLKIIVNNRNFGHVRSPYYGMLQATGEATIFLASDLEDPPEMIPQFVRKWEEGFKLVLGQKTSSEESSVFYLVRKFYYFLVNRLSDVPLVKNVTGFGLYDRQVMDDIRKIGDPYPYFRGMICDLGYEQALIPYRKPVRKRGFSKNNFYTLYDLAILGITNHSKVPLRLSVMAGLSMGLLSFLVGVAYLIYKLLFWNNFSVGTAPVVIGMFFLGSIQLFCIGMLGEYIGSIHTQVLKRPLVIEKERINFDSGPAGNS